ncbi:hypothetical protein CROQUDRAFT_714005 [Cronartium quercuum f. sp. fusiforme G11]|uniref:GAF domain-containing protein n=1 Tax=Cronartium quercuum f. sp. fusiforme G11 TaxID=708437 RepID=A0A9P6TEJ2_9BASI|nr:hypothetical protein CROQUDRAFT_714005 [Cronartium quercuum f. sp. fusiforme G11]
MSQIIAAPLGYGLPYSALFSVPKRHHARRRSPHYFWEKAIASPTQAPVVSGMNNISVVQTTSTWLDDDAPAVSDSEDNGVVQSLAPCPPSKKKSFARLRQIAFRAFVPKVGSNKPSTVVATEIVTQKQLPNNDPLAKNGHGSGFTFFNSWRVKAKGVNAQVQKLAAVVRHRVSSKSPEDQKPKTWEEYHRCYAAGQIDINDPPLPPIEPNPDQPTPFEKRCYIPPDAEDEPVRQLVINRLEVFGRTAFDMSDDGVACAQARTELAEKLERDGQAPTTLKQAWHRPLAPTGSKIGRGAIFPKMNGVGFEELVPETLEQHPVFRKIVRQCREMFGVSISALSIMEAERQIFLAESGMDGLREAPRGLTVCAHTVLSGRKGFTILDTLKDWRFSSSPLVLSYAARFYAGVPLMAPNLDGAPESEDAACPIGTLCILDHKPRKSFGPEERKKLVYMAEYARREIELWFKSKISQKVTALEESHRKFIQEVEGVGSLDDDPTGQQAEVLTGGSNVKVSDRPQLSREPSHESKMRDLRRFGSSRSLVSTPPTTPSTSCHATGSPRLNIPHVPSLFDDMGLAVKPRMQKVFDLATELVGSSLDLSLVYLLAVTPHGDSINAGRTLILSGYKLPLPIPSFNAGLHLRVLRASEGGMLYQNPSAQQVQDEGLMPSSTTGSNPYASAILVRVGPEPAVNVGGFVMAGFTSDAKRVFGAEDVTYMKKFAIELTRYTLQLRL